MSLRFKDAPSAAGKELAKAGRLWSDRALRLRLSAQVPVDLPEGEPTFQPGFAHTVYTLNLSQLLNNEPIADLARPTSLRFLIPDPVAAGSIEISVSGDELRFAELNYGPYAQNTLDQIQSLQSSPAFRGEDYEVRLLRIPALNIQAIWLQSAWGTDMFFPLAPTTSSLEPGRSYSEQAFLDAIRSEAKAVQEAGWAAQESELLARSHASVLALSPADLLRLRRFADLLVRGVGRAALKQTWKGLLKEALARTIAGNRNWEEQIDLATHLFEQMRNISQTWDRPSEAPLESENWLGPRIFIGDDQAALDAINLLPGYKGSEAQTALMERPTEYTQTFNRIRSKLLRPQTEVAEAVKALSTRDLMRLHSYARKKANLLLYLGKAKGRDEQDLLQEAIVATLEGRRTWNADRNLVEHLTGVMSSISSAWGQERRETHYEEESAQSSTEGSPSSTENILPPVTIDPERIVQARQSLKRVQDLFSGDQLALEVVSLRGQGFSAREIQQELSISPAEFDAASRRVRRTLNSHGPS